MGEDAGMFIAEDALSIGTIPHGASFPLSLSPSSSDKSLGLPLRDAGILISCSFSSGLLLTEIPESELKVSCRFHEILALL
jgi:hypothetical protein